MYKATIKDKEQNGDLLELNIEFSNGEKSFEESFSVKTASELDSIISAKLKELNTTKITIADVAAGEYVPVPEKPDVVLQQKLTEVYKLKQMVDVGIIAPDAPEYLQALDEARTAYHSK